MYLNTKGSDEHEIIFVRLKEKPYYDHWNVKFFFFLVPTTKEASTKCADASIVTRMEGWGCHAFIDYQDY